MNRITRVTAPLGVAIGDRKPTNGLKLIVEPLSQETGTRIKNTKIDKQLIIEGLRTAREIMPDRATFIYGFTDFLAARLQSSNLSANGKEISPLEFMVEVEFILADLQRGFDRYTEQPIRNGLSEHSTEFYNSLRDIVPFIAETVCPKEFANLVAILAGRLEYLRTTDNMPQAKGIELSFRIVP